MKKNWKAMLILGIILIVLILSGVYTILSARIPHNDISVTGNTAGNLNNKGLFAEADGRVYFSNAYDSGCLYSMNADETDLKKINSSPVNSINVGGNYLYYFMNNSSGGTGLGYVVRTYGIFRSKLNGKNITMQLSGDYLYYQRYNNTDFTQLYKIKTDKSDNTLVYDGVINPAACFNGMIYFNGTEDDHYLYALNTTTDAISTIYQGNLWNPVYQDGYIYYMDVAEDYRLCRLSLSQNTVHAYGEDTPVYHTPVNGPVNVTTFDAALNTALSK